MSLYVNELVASCICSFVGAVLTGFKNSSIKVSRSVVAKFPVVDVCGGLVVVVLDVPSGKKVYIR